MTLLKEITLLMIVLVNGESSVSIVRGNIYNAVFGENGGRLCAVGSVDSPSQRYFVTGRPVAECARFCLYYSDCIAFNIYDNGTCDLITCQSFKRFLAIDACKAFLDVKYDYIQVPDTVSPEENLALKRPATQSSTYEDVTVGACDATRAVDGSYEDGNMLNLLQFSCSNTNDGPGGPNWWRVQLDRPYRVQKVIVTNRKDCCADRLDYFIVRVTNSTEDPVTGSYPLCGQFPSTAGLGATVTLDCDPNIVAGQYVIIQQPFTGTGYLTLCEVEVYARPVRNSPCDLKPCRNGGTCTESGSDYECSCPSGYSGKNCETDVCPSGFEYFPEINQCLFLNLEPMTWDDARTACTRMKTGAQMVAIKDSAKQEAVRRYLEHQFAKQESSVCASSKWIAGGKISWLGGQTRDPNQCGTPYFWKPVGTAETPFTYTNWHPGLPHCIWGQQNCAIIPSASEFNYQWEDIECDVLLCSVCEF